MLPAERTIAIWTPRGRQPQSLVTLLAETARREGGLAAITRWREALEGQRVAYVHGARHDLWWEFDLASSFQWQAQIHRIAPDSYRRRLQALTSGLEIGHLLTCAAAELTPAQRALADLAVNLLHRPRLLVWDEPFALLDGTDRVRACEVVNVLTAVEGLTVVLAAAQPPGVKEEWRHERNDAAGVLDCGHSAHPWAAGRRVAAGGTQWA
jgi:ABC-type Mn2+/Zn2+ transport system ATPase subunit